MSDVDAFQGEDFDHPLAESSQSARVSGSRTFQKRTLVKQKAGRGSTTGKTWKTLKKRLRFGTIRRMKTPKTHWGPRLGGFTLLLSHIKAAMSLSRESSIVMFPTAYPSKMESTCFGVLKTSYNLPNLKSKEHGECCSLEASDGFSSNEYFTTSYVSARIF